MSTKRRRRNTEQPKAKYDVSVRPHLGLSSNLLRLMGSFVRPTADGGGGAEGALREWVFGFLIAQERMLESVVVLTRQGLGHEAGLQMRAMMEGVGTMYFMAEDPHRAVVFAREQAVEQQRLVDRGMEYGLGGDEAREARDRFVEDRVFLMQHLGDEPPRVERQTWPLNARVADRLAAAGMTWHHDLVWEVTSNLSHMNARTVASYLDSGMAATRPRSATVVLANEMGVRALWLSEKLLAQGHTASIVNAAREHARIAYPHLPETEVLRYLRVEEDRVADESPP